MRMRRVNPALPSELYTGRTITANARCSNSAI